MAIDNNEFPFKIPSITGLNSGNIDELKDFAFGSDGLPSYTSPLVNMMRGMKIFGGGPQMAPVADDTIGLAFVSRPLCNLSDDNCARHPQLADLYKPAKNSPQQYIKCLLDKREGDRNSCDILDNKMGWMVILTNLLKQSDGFGDVDLEVSTIDGGFRGEVHQQIAGLLDENGAFSIRQTYYNVKGGLIPDIFNKWMRYEVEVTLGDCGVEPYPEADYQNYIDHDCRIYHLIMNKNMRNISHMFMTLQSMPTSFPVGAMATINNDTSNRRGEGQEEITINFSSVGMRYDSWEIAEGFNGTTVYFNEDMKPTNRLQKYVKLKPSEYLTMQYNAYPWINIETMELEWWADRQVYARVMQAEKTRTPAVLRQTGTLN